MASHSKRIAFMSSGPYPIGKDICIMDADGSNIINLTNTPGIDDHLPVWLPQ
jgi:Tol biopolymer transport system component